MDGKIGELTKEGVHGVVLSAGMVQVLTGIFVLGVFTEHSLVEEEGVVVGMGPSGGFEEDTEVGIGHFVISHEED